MSAFRCATASLGRSEPMTATASTVRAFLLVENAGPWGIDALRDARLAPEVRDTLRVRSAAAGVRTLLVRRHRGGVDPHRVRVFAAYADAHAPWLETASLPPADLGGLDLDALGRGESPGLTPTDEPLFAVCTHGRHDACCAEQGRPTVAALAQAHPERTWEVSHIGGDRFAANLLVLPDGLYYGRVTAQEAPGLVDRHLAGHLDVDLLRGRSGLSFPVQAAEVAARRVTGVTGIRDVRVLGVHSDGDLSVVRLRVAGAAYEVRVRSSMGPARLLTCRARGDSPVPQQNVIDVREV